MSHHHHKHSAALGLAFLALAAPAAVAQQQDLRSPDARDAAAPAVDARQDLRSPDSSDAAAGRGASSAPDVRVVRLTAPSPAAGIDWADAGVGAAGLLGVILVALSTFAIVHRRHGGPARRRTVPSG